MKGSTFKRCGCTEVVRNTDGAPVLDARGKPKRRQLGNSCPKLRRSDGTWNPRHGKWYFAVSSRGLGGKRMQHPRGGFASEAEALAELEKVKATIGRGVTPTGVRLEAWLPQWLDAKLDIRPNTRLSYSGHITNYLVPHLGHHRLDGLRVEHVAELLAAVPGSDATRQRVRATLRAALTDAQRQGLVTVNVAALVKLPAGRRPKALVWTTESEARWRETLVALIATGKGT